MLALGVVLAAAGATVAAIRRLFRPYQLPEPPGRMFDLAGERLHVVERGAGRPVILVHGFAGNTFSWRFLLESPPPGYRFIAVDLPGWGFSDRGRALDYSHEAHARRLAALMDQLGLERATVAGHSMGGGIAQRLAVSFPERVERLVLVGSVDSSVKMRRPGKAPGMERALRLAQRSAPLMFWAGRRGLKECVYDTSLVDDAMVRGYIEPLLLPGTVEATFAMAQATGDESLADLGRIQCPVLVVGGDTDRVVPRAVAERLHEALPGSSLRIFQRCGHLVPEELPGRFAEELVAFIEAGEQ